MANTIKIKAGTGTPDTNDIVDRELAFDRSANKLYIRDNDDIVDLSGSASLDTEAVQDIVGAMFSGNTETRISATYQDGDGTIDLVVDDMTADTNTQLSTEQVQDIVGAMFTGNTETRITATYQDADGTIDLVVDDLDTDTQLTTENVQDIVGAMFSSNTETRVAATYDDTNGKIDLVVDDMTADTNTQLSTEQVQDIVGAMFSGNTETRISATYQDGDGTIDLVVDDMTANTQLSNSQVRSAVEAASDSNVFTDADHSKLNGIEASATADQTASEILTAIKTVDGASSGLDADLLDGHHASAFLGVSAKAADSELLDGINSSEFLRSNANDDFSGTLNYTPDTGTILSVDGQAILQRMTANGAITIGHDDAVIIAGGDTSGTMNSNINNATETVFLGAEGGFVVYAFPNNDTSWSNRKELNYNGTALDVEGNITVSGTVDGRDVASDGSKLDGIASGATANSGTVTSVATGGGLTGGTITGSGTISHADTSSQASSNNSGRTYIQDITLDTYGHVTGISTATETVTNTDTNTQLSNEQVQDIVGAMFSGNTETRITATYQDGDGTIDLVVDDLNTDTQLSNEQVQDIVGAMFSGNTETRISATYQDGDGTIDLVVDDFVSAGDTVDFNNLTCDQIGVNVSAQGTDGRIDAGNDIVAFSSSDKRLKENIKPLDNALDKVMKISGIEFDWKKLTKEEKKTIHGNEGHDVGVIAQEIEEVLPEVVQTRDTGYKAVKYEKIVPLLIEAIKELKEEVEELKK